VRPASHQLTRWRDEDKVNYTSKSLSPALHHLENIGRVAGPDRTSGVRTGQEVVARGKEEIHSEWILDESLIRLTWKTGAESREEFHGIDPATGQWTTWGFHSKGRVIRASARARRRASGVTGFGPGKDGPMSIKHKNVKLGPDEDRYEIHEFILDGKAAT
jgi:hypothetical protein